MKIFICALCVLFACFSTHAKNLPITQKVNEYLEVYQERNDFERFMRFYAEQAQLEDMVYGYHAKSKSDIRAFFNWSHGDFKVLQGAKAFSIEELVIDEKQRLVVFSGIFHRFSYTGKIMGPWRFTTRLKFNDLGLIIYQQDWINYTPKAQFLNGQNLNPNIEAVQSQ